MHTRSRYALWLGLPLVGILVMGPRCDGDPLPGELVPATNVDRGMNMQLAAPVHGDFVHKELRVLATYYDAPAAFDHRLRKLVSYYFLLSDQLRQRDLSTATATASAMEKHATSAETLALSEEAKAAWFGHRRVLSTSLHQLEVATTLLEKLKHFSHVTEALYCAVRSFDAIPEAIYVAFCSTALPEHGAYWLSRERKLASPYADEEATSCGEVVEVLGSRRPDHADQLHQ